MKTLVLPFLFLTSLFSFSQNFQSENISEAEAKAATGWFGQSVNMNTGNYDLKYQRLELTVDPAQPFISGKITSHFIAKENLNTVTFELVDNMTVSQVTQRGTR